MQAPPPDMNYGYEPPRKKSNSWIWIVVAVLAICGCGAVVILPAVLLPVFMQAKLAASRTVCISNMKRLGMTEMMYATDHDDYLPPAKSWLDASQANMPSDRIDTCPAVLAKRGEYGYSFAKALGGKKLTNVPVPAEAVLFYETADLVRNASGDPEKEPPPNRHGRGRTMVYADGRAKWERSRRDSSGSE